MTAPHSLAPGFMVVHGNRPETLRDLVLAWMKAHPADPLEDEVVLVQSNGVAQWLRLAMARDEHDGGLGIAAAVRTELPQRFVWQAYRHVLGAQAVPRHSPFDADRLSWRLMRVLPPLLGRPAFAPLARYLRDDPAMRRRFQLSERLAVLLEHYQVYRPDWLDDWADGRDVLAGTRGPVAEVPAALAWQPMLWRALMDDAGPAEAALGRATTHRRFLQAVRDAGRARPPALPRRLVVFGVSSLPPQALEAFAALGRWAQVLMVVHNPSRHDWSRIVGDHELLRARRYRQQPRHPRDDASARPEGHPLLAAWGRQGRDFIRLLDEHDDHEAYRGRFSEIGRTVDCFEDPPTGTLLGQLQDDVLELRPLVESRARWPAVDPARDRSIRFHVAHGPQREVEVLHDQLLAALAEDPTLRPRDVLVMVPDVAGYAPHVQAVFGRLAPGDARWIPFSITDRGQRHHDPLVGALATLLELPQGRLAVGEVLDLLDVPALRQRFGFETADLPVVRRWVEAACVRWGLHAAHRAELGWTDAVAQNTWSAGLQRMLLGYAIGRGHAWRDIEPIDEVGGLEAALLGPVARLLQALDRHRHALSTPAAPDEWVARLRAMAEDFFEAPRGGDGYTLVRLESALQDWQETCAAARLAEPLTLEVVREHWLAQLDAGGLGRPFLGGGVTVATLMPMRAIPFRFVALLGMNDGEYPRSQPPSDFDLMAIEGRPGDRSRREDDRFLFLEAVLSARDRLHVSWVGRSIHDNEPRPPSVLVAQLRDHLAAGWRPVDDGHGADAGRRLLAALTVEHPLQPFDPAYFATGHDDRLFSHAREWRAGLAARAAAVPTGGALAPGPSVALGPATAVEPPTLRRLADFLREPARGFFEHRLGIVLSDDDDTLPEDEPFVLDGLEQWALTDELLRAQRAALRRDGPTAREAALEAMLDGFGRAGRLPAGAFGRMERDELARPMADLFARLARAEQCWPHACPDERIVHVEAAAEPGLQDWLTDLRRDDAGQRARVLADPRRMQDRDGEARAATLLAYWVEHLAGHLGGQPMTTVVVSTTGAAVLPPLDPDTARAAWDALLAAWREGLRRPLPFAPQSAIAWLDAIDADPGDERGAYSAARRRYEDHAPDRGQFGERERLACTRRAFADFAALWADGEFGTLARRLLEPLRAALRTDLADPTRAAEPQAAATDGDAA